MDAIRTRSQKVNEAMRQYLMKLARSIELAPGRSYTFPFARLHENLKALLPEVSLNEMESLYLPRLSSRFEHGVLGLTQDVQAKTFTITNLRPVPGPDVLVYVSAILRQKEGGKRVFVEEFHTQRSTSKVEHRSVVEDWSFIFTEIGPLDLDHYEKLDARRASEEEFQQWLARKNAKGVYYHFLE
jgi:hypothetical protein